MAKIALLLDDMFEYSEYAKPVQEFLNHGHKVIRVGLAKGKSVKSKNAHPIIIDQSVEDVSIDDFDALFIPGGHSPEKLKKNQTAVAFAGQFVKRNKPVFAICHGPQLLVSAQVLKDRTVTGSSTIRHELEDAGARYLDKAVVHDGNLVSSRMPEDIPAFIKTSLAVLNKRAEANNPDA